jgi:hypothetical protein
MSTTSVIRLPRLGKRRMAELTSKAKSLGMTPQRYIRSLIEEDLELDRKARATTFAELMAPGRDVDEAELNRLVDEARTRHHSGKRAQARVRSAPLCTFAMTGYDRLK